MKALSIKLFLHYPLNVTKYCNFIFILINKKWNCFHYKKNPTHLAFFLFSLKRCDELILKYLGSNMSYVYNEYRSPRISFTGEIPTETICGFRVYLCRITFTFLLSWIPYVNSFYFKKWQCINVFSRRQRHRSRRCCQFCNRIMSFQVTECFDLNIHVILRQKDT